MPETPVLQSEVPGEETAKTQPIPSKPAPYAQQGLEEDDLIDYTPEIKAAALHLAKLCRMGRTYVPPSAIDGTTPQHCSWYAPGASGGVNIDGGAAVDPDTGMLYVGVADRTQHDRSREGSVLRTPLHAGRRANSCGKLGAPPPPPGYVRRLAALAAAVEAVAARWRRRALVAGAAPAGASYKDASPGTTTIAGISILKPQRARRDHGLQHEHRRQGLVDSERRPDDRAGGEAEQPGRGAVRGRQAPAGAGARPQPQVMNTTQTLVIYGTGRSGAAAADGTNRLYAVDKATGKQFGAVDDSREHERRADDVHAPGPAVHRVCDRRPEQACCARRAGAASGKVGTRSSRRGTEFTEAAGAGSEDCRRRPLAFRVGSVVGRLATASRLLPASQPAAASALLQRGTHSSDRRVWRAPYSRGSAPRRPPGGTS